LIELLILDQGGMEERDKMNKPINKQFLNLKSYKFIKLDHLEDHRQLLAEIGQLLSVTGTIILSEEGINVALSGNKSSVEQMFEACKAIPGLQNLEPKSEFSEDCRFSKLKVKVKQEIIKMDQPQIQPSTERAPSIDSLTLNRWILEGRDDAGQPLKIIDTRNEFEFQLGHFKNSLNLNIDRFSEFPIKIQQKEDCLKGFKLVNVCTGGIRCEKATLYMMEKGIKNVVQLDGGILDYLQKTNGYSWEGECFQFDDRELLSV